MNTSERTISTPDIRNFGGNGSFFFFLYASLLCHVVAWSALGSLGLSSHHPAAFRVPQPPRVTLLPPPVREKSKTFVDTEGLPRVEKSKDETDLISPEDTAAADPNSTRKTGSGLPAMDGNTKALSLGFRPTPEATERRLVSPTPERPPTPPTKAPVAERPSPEIPAASRLAPSPPTPSAPFLPEPEKAPTPERTRPDKQPTVEPRRQPDTDTPPKPLPPPRTEPKVPTPPAGEPARPEKVTPLVFEQPVLPAKPLVPDKTDYPLPTPPSAPAVPSPPAPQRPQPQPTEKPVPRTEPTPASARPPERMPLTRPAPKPSPPAPRPSQAKAPPPAPVPMVTGVGRDRSLMKQQEESDAEKGVRLSLKTNRHDYARYLKKVRTKIQLVWILGYAADVRLDYQTKDGKPIVVDFTILPDGKLGGATIHDDAGNPYLAGAIKKSIMEAAPFPRFRDYGVHEDNISIRFISYTN